VLAEIVPGPLRDVLTLVLGVVTGVLSGAFGVGGAIISTPGVRLLGASAFVAVGTTLPSIVPGAAVGAARYFREGLIDRRALTATAPAGILAAVVGSLASHAIPGGGHWLMVLTAALLGVTAFRMARSALASGGPGSVEQPRPRRGRSRPRAWGPQPASSPDCWAWAEALSWYPGSVRCSACR